MLAFAGLAVALVLSGVGPAAGSWTGNASPSTPPNPYYVYGYVRYQNGTPSVGATVYVNDTTANTSQTATSGSGGKYQVSALLNPKKGDNVSVVADYLGVFGNNTTTVVSTGAGSGSWCNVTLVPVNLTATLTSNPSGPFVNQTVTLVAHPHGGVPPYAYTWTFGDGSGSSVTSTSTTTHSYSHAGTFTANVSVAASGSTPANASTNVNVVPAPTLSMGWSPSSPRAGASTTLFANLSLIGSGWRYIFLFGDGNQSGPGVPGANTVVHVYARAGTYTVNATAYNSTSGYRVDSKKYTLTVIAGIVLTLNGAPLPTEVGVNTTFTAAQAGSSSPVNYTFTFGDGATSGPGAQSTAVHVYAKPGNFNATVQGTNSTGTSATSNVVSVSVLPAVVVSLAASPLSGTAPLTTTLTATPTLGKGPYVLTFKLGTSTLSKQSGTTLKYTLNNSGNYTFTVTVQDALGASSSASAKVSVTSKRAPSPLSASISGPSQGVTGASLTFTVNASGGTTPYTYFWEFGDGQSLSGTTGVESHSYSTTGNFTITVWVNDSAGQSKVVTHLVTITSTSTPTPQPGSFLSNTLDLFLLILVIIILLLVLLFAMRRRRKPEEEEQSAESAEAAPAATPAEGPSGVPEAPVLETAVEAGAVGAAATAAAEPAPEPAAADEVSSPPIEETPASPEVPAPEPTPPEPTPPEPTSPEPTPSEPVAPEPEAAPPVPEPSTPEPSPPPAEPATSSREKSRMSRKEMRKLRRQQRNSKASAAAGTTASAGGSGAEAAPESDASSPPQGESASESPSPAQESPPDSDSGAA